MNNPPAETTVLTATVSSAPPAWRMRLVYLLQLVGILLALAGSAELLGVLDLFSPDVARKLALAGPTLATAARPAILLFGDYLDDGVRNQSFTLEPVTKAPEDPNQLKLLCWFLMVGLCFGMCSCGVTVHSDGSKSADLDVVAAAALLTASSNSLLNQQTSTK